MSKTLLKSRCQKIRTETLVEKIPYKKRPKHPVKTRQKKTVLICSSKTEPTKKLTITTSKNCNGKNTVTIWSTNKPRIQVQYCPQNRCKSQSMIKVIELLVNTYRSKTLPKKQPTLLFQKRPYRNSRQTVPFKGAVQNTGKSSLPRKYRNEMLVIKLFYKSAVQNTVKKWLS